MLWHETNYLLNNYWSFSHAIIFDFGCTIKICIIYKYNHTIFSSVKFKLYSLKDRHLSFLKTSRTILAVFIKNMNIVFHIYLYLKCD